MWPGTEASCQQPAWKWVLHIWSSLHSHRSSLSPPIGPLPSIQRVSAMLVFVFFPALQQAKLFPL